MFPNPSKGIFTITGEKDVKWIVYDILGSNIGQGNGRTIDLSGKPSGIYFLQSNDTTIKLLVE
ncbi:MAG: T9SS type A sorting domain-containing protein [Flavobacterium sp.]|nr:T9SS type A sorting domain-containing protein [Flavobacterium sp.]